MKRLLLLALCLFWFSNAFSSHADLNVRFCLAKDASLTSVEHKEMMSELGINCATLYYKLNAEENRTHPYDWVRFKYLDAEMEVVLVLIIDDGKVATTARGQDNKDVTIGNLQKVVGGDYDQALRELVSVIVRDGRHIKVRLFHEFDGFWFPWSIHARGNSSELFLAAVTHVVSLFETQRAPVTYEVNVNRENGYGEVLGEAASLLPALQKLVHSIAVSTYNRGCTSKDHPYDRSFQYEFRPVYNLLASRFDWPVNVAEVSTAGACGPRLPWLEAMLESIDKDFHRVREVTFFFGEGTASDGSVIDWALKPSDYAAFRELLDTYRQKWQ